ncbi:MAG: hypothetical protein JRI68_13085 [Deltaproteobacteria bacterium]|nr:hypothetical protein [Deltaproteobacteria bacterium]
MRRPSHGLVAGGVALALLSSASAVAAQGGCGESGGWTVGLTAGLGAVVGAAGALISSGVIAAADDTRDYSFGIGAGAGIGVTAGLSAVYLAFDLGTGCGMANDTDGVAWSVPITTILVGTALPVAVWGGSDEIEETEAAQAALSALGSQAAGRAAPPAVTFTWQF